MTRWSLLLLLGACSTVVPTTYPGDRLMWDGIFARAEALHFDARPVAAVAPHHLIDAHELAGFWAELARFRPSRVVLVAPDHFSRGAPLSMASAAVSWRTEYGLVRSAPLPLGVPFRDEVFPQEHSVHAHSSYLARLLPGVPVTVVTLQWGAPRAALEALAQRLAAALPGDALVVASVDFSHYQPEPWATFHDASAFSSVAGFDLDALFLREVDSPESLFVALRFAQLRGAERATRWLHTNSQKRRVVFVDDSTSHQYFTFAKGPRAPRPSVSVTLSGDVPPGTGLRHVEGWTWHPTRPSGAPQTPWLARLRGKEDRFFMGPELVLFDLPPGQTLRRTVNGLELVVRSVALAEAPALAPEGSPGPCVITLAHRGALPRDEAERRARALLTSSAVVLGRGFGPATPEEWVGEKLLVLSLGDWSQPASPAAVAGVTCSGEGVRATVLPVVVDAQGPALDLTGIGAFVRPAQEGLPSP
jgi:AmmeMemoRadiSam system protein B